MGSVTVYLNPPLDGARLELRYRSYGLDELLFTFYSVDGVMYTPQGTLTNYDVFEVRFPAQTVDGIPYLEESTGGFLFYGDLEYTFDLEEAVVVEGHIGVIYYWIEGMAGWEFLEAYPTPAKVGDEIHLAVGWINDGSAAIVGHVDAQLTSPALYTHLPDAVLNQDKSANPGSGWVVQFAPITLNESGSWEFYGQITLDGTIVDTKQITFEVTEAPPASATVKVRGICTGGYPAPSMLLEIYDKGVKIASNNFGVIVIGNWYEFETGVTGAGIHTVYGRMVLTNPLGSYEFTTPTEEFELG